jgi:hypothetical protein
VLPKAGFELEAIWDLPEIDFVSQISDRLMLDPKLGSFRREELAGSNRPQKERLTGSSVWLRLKAMARLASFRPKTSRFRGALGGARNFPENGFVPST